MPTTFYFPQLPAAAKINWADPITSGLTMLCLPTYGAQNILSPATATLYNSPNPRISSYPIGPAYEGAVAGGGGFGVPVAAPTLGFSLFSFSAITQSVNQVGGQIIEHDDQPGSNRAFQFLMNGAAPQFITFTTGGSPTLTTYSALSSADQARGWIQTGRISAVEKVPYLTVNGQTISSAALASVQMPNTARLTAVGSVAGGTVQFIGGIYIAAMWGRKLTDAENARLHADPFCFVRPQIRQVDYSAPAGASWQSLANFPDQAPGFPRAPRQTGAAPMGPGIAPTPSNTVPFLPTLPIQIAPVKTPNVSGSAPSGPGIAPTPTNTLPWAPTLPIQTQQPRSQPTAATPFVPSSVAVTPLPWLPVAPIQIQQPSRQTAGEFALRPGIAPTPTNTVPFLPMLPTQIQQPARQTTGVAAGPLPPTNLTWLPTYPASVQQLRAVQTGATPFVPSVVPSAGLFWLPVLPTQIAPITPPQMPAGAVLQPLQIAISPLAWFPTYPSVVVQPLRVTQYLNYTVNPLPTNVAPIAVRAIDPWIPDRRWKERLQRLRAINRERDRIKREDAEEIREEILDIIGEGKAARKSAPVREAFNEVRQTLPSRTPEKLTARHVMQITDWEPILAALDALERAIDEDIERDDMEVIALYQQAYMR